LDVSIHRQSIDVTRIVGDGWTPLRPQVAGWHIHKATAFITRPFRVPQQFPNGVIEREQASLDARVVRVYAQRVVMEERRRRPDADQCRGPEVTRAAEGPAIIILIICPEQGIELDGRGIRTEGVEIANIADGL